MQMEEQREKQNDRARENYTFAKTNRKDMQYFAVSIVSVNLVEAEIVLLFYIWFDAKNSHSLVCAEKTQFHLVCLQTDYSSVDGAS